MQRPTDEPVSFPGKPGCGRNDRGFAIPAPPKQALSDRAIRKARADSDFVRSLMGG